jgi:sterol desaturase/sphingolipid hydroxylase (fatty acid hydroxylase superfamily)
MAHRIKSEGQPMQLSKLTYYSDFWVYPLVITALVAVNITYATGHSAPEWLCAGTAGFLLWTLSEYVVHRTILHRTTYFAPAHGAHHASPLAFIGTPCWISVSVLSLVILGPAWLWLGFNVADGLTVGIMLGYWWYGVVHHVIHHHANTSSPSYFNDLRAWHMRHHYSPKSGNFGVTTSVWDHVFGTAINVRDKAVVSS